MPEREIMEIDERNSVRNSLTHECSGPKAVTFIGRVVSFATIIGKSAKQARARGWHYVGVRGEGGVVSVSGV